jgi:ribosome-associated heat shock protein Hsp15
MPGEGRQRIDKWLFFARVLKSRSLAAKLVEAGRVRIDGERSEKASDFVKPGDVLTINLDRSITILKVVAPGERRGPYEEARKLYEDLTPPPVAPDIPSAQVPVREAGSGRPTKKERRAIDRLTDGD